MPENHVLFLPAIIAFPKIIVLLYHSNIGCYSTEKYRKANAQSLKMNQYVIFIK